MKAKRQLVILTGILLLASMVSAETLATFYDDAALQERVISISQADGTFTQEQDLSIFFLQLLFGGVSELQGLNKIIGEVFKLFNYGLLGIVSFIVGYTVLTSVIGTSQDSGGAFSTRVSPWTIARTSAGVTLMFPMNSGYSLVQTMVMKIVLMGIAFANTGWNAALSHMESTGGKSFEVSAGNAQATAEYNLPNSKKAFSALALMYKPLYKAYTQCVTSGGCDASSRIRSIGYSGKYIVNFATGKPGGASYSLIGDSSIPKLYTLVNSTERRVMDQSLTTALNSMLALMQTHSETPMSDVKNTTLLTEGDKQFALVYSCPGTVLSSGKFKYSTDCMGDAQNEDNIKVKARREEVGRAIATQAKSLANFAAYMKNVEGSTTDPDSWISKARGSGWLSAGIYYTQLMSFNDSTSVAEEEDPALTFVDGLPEEISVFSGPVGDSPQFLADEGTKLKVDDYILSPDEGLNLNDSSVAQDNDTARLIAKVLIPLHAYTIQNDTTKALIPDLAGRSGGGWVYGVDPTKPIQNFGKMTLKVVQQLIGYKYLGDGKDNFTINASCTLTELTKGFLSLLGVSNEEKPPKSCLYPGSMWYSANYPADTINPLKTIRDLGKTMIEQSVKYYADTVSDLFSEIKHLADSHFAVSSVISGTATGIEAATTAGPAAWAGVVAGTVSEITVSGLKMAFNGVKIALEVFVPVGTAVAAVFFSLGVVLAVYIPMLPFVLFLFGVVAWLMSVTEAMVAAPLVALGMTHPEGHDLLGKSEQALILLLGVFVRPITMLFGILMAIIVSQILVGLFHLSFSSLTVAALLSTKSSSGDVLTGQAVVACGILLIYIYVLMSVIEQSYSLIYVIPERILRWVGGPQDQSGVGQLAEQAKGETQQAAGQAASGAQVSGPSVGAPDAKFSNPESDEAEEEGENENGGSEVSGSDSGKDKR